MCPGPSNLIPEQTQLLLQNSTKALSACWGQALLGRPFLTFLSTSVATSFAQIRLRWRTTRREGHTSLASFILFDAQSFYSLHRHSQKCSFSDYHLSSDSGQPVTEAYQGFIWGYIKHFGGNFRYPEFLP